MTSAASEDRPSGVRGWFERWVAASMPAAPLERFRMAFAVIWIAYDAFDLRTRGTQACSNWLSAPAGSIPRLVFLQVALLGFEIALLVGWRVGLSALVCALLRAAEWDTFLRLNDFAYFGVTAFLIAQTRSTGGLFRRAKEGQLVPAWPRDLLLAELGWMYFATALMKLSPVWLSGGHLYVRHQYLATAYNWPYPAAFLRWTQALPHDALLAWAGVTSEFALAMAIFARRRVAIPLAIAVHGFGALGVNVWFFGASCVAQVVFLIPARRDGKPPAARVSA